MTLITLPNIFLLFTSLLLISCAGSNAGIQNAYEKLEVPPEIVAIPSKEVATDKDDKLRTNGLGTKVSLQGSDEVSLLVVEDDFDKTWAFLEQVLRHNKIMITDRNRDQGYLWVNFDTGKYDSEEGVYSAGDGVYASEDGFLSGLSHTFLGKTSNWRKYQLSVKKMDKPEFTQISAVDKGAITKFADRREKIEEVVDPKIAGPENSQKRILSVLYKSLQEGFEESISHHERFKRD